MTYFPPLPPSSFDPDYMRQWLSQQNISAQRLLSGEVQSGVAIGSEDYVAGSTGWQITGDGDAEFNDVTVRGSLIAGGSGVFLDILAPPAQPWIRWFDDETFLGYVGVDTSLDEFHIHTFDIPMVIEVGSDLEIDSTGGDVTLNGDEVHIQASSTLQARFGTVASGVGTRLLGVRDTTTGSAANVFINSGTGVTARSTSALKYKTDIKNADHLADIKLEPVKFYREDDDRHSYGFIADWLGDQDELLGEYDEGEIENYDQRAILAVLAAKINRLERAGGEGRSGNATG